MKKSARLFICFLLALSIAFSANLYSVPEAEAASPKTGIGLAAHVLRAYNQGWRYVYGAYGQISGNTRIIDCSGLIKSYLWWTNDSSNPKAFAVPVSGNMIATATVSGTVDRNNMNSIPNIHGLIMYHEGHVGVYVGNNMAVDCRNATSGMRYQKVCGPGGYRWTHWFKLPQVQYPNTGWVRFNGQSFYYENGEYVENVTKTIKGVSYCFGIDGALIGAEPPAEDYLAVDYTSPVVPRQPSPSSSKPSSDNTAPVVYKTGSQGDMVKTIQTRLKELGYFLEDITGYYGDVTADAVKSFQKQAGLTQTGKTDETTLLRLKAGNAPEHPEISEGDTGKEVLMLKEKLEELRYLEEETDDAFGPLMTEAVMAFQAVHSLEETGKVDAATLIKLFSDDALENPDAGLLRLGKTGEKVSNLQKRLEELRYLTAYEYEDGLFDEATQEAVRTYQKAAGMEKTGELREEEQGLLYKEEAVISPDWELLRKGFSGNDVEKLQRDLLELDFYSGEINGLFEEETEVSLKKFQSERGLRATGTVDDAEREELKKALSEREKLTAIGRYAGEKLLDLTVPQTIRIFTGPFAKEKEESTKTNVGLLLGLIAAGAGILALGTWLFFCRRKRLNTLRYKRVGDERKRQAA